MRWIVILGRIAGAATPFGSVLLQARAELNDAELQQRLRKLEDPISSLHPDVIEFSEKLYDAVSEINNWRVVPDEETLARYGRVMAILESQGLIRGSHSSQKRFHLGLWLDNPHYIMYMCALFEDPDLMERLLSRVDSTPPKTWLRGAELAEEFALPLPVVRAVFQLYEAKSLGLLSKELGAVNYFARA